MSERYGSPPKASAVSEAIGSTVNLLSFIYARISFPTFSNGLKEIGKWLGSNWSENGPSGLKAIAWRHKWESSLDQTLKTSLVDYNADDCRALEEMRLLIGRISLARQTRHADSIIESQIIRAEQTRTTDFQKWREFKSTIPEFELSQSSSLELLMPAGSSAYPVKNIVVAGNVEAHEISLKDAGIRFFGPQSKDVDD
jgi:hypothetical protein